MSYRILALLYLFTFLISSNASSSASSFAMVFHEKYCRNNESDINHYMDNVRLNGYSVFYLCTDTIDIKTLKKRINQKAIENGTSLSNISGINLYGPVTSTEITEHLQVQVNSSDPTTTLAVDNIELILSNDRIIDVKVTNKNSLNINRWVTHILPSLDESDTDFPRLLYGYSNHISPMGSLTIGEKMKKTLQNSLLNIRTIKYYDFPDGEGTSIIGMASLPAIWIVTGLSRMYEGYSFWNRFQTYGDKFGSPILISLMLIIEAYSIKSYFSTQYYQAYDKRWKKLLLKKPLHVDGLFNPNIQK